MTVYIEKECDIELPFDYEDIIRKVVSGAAEHEGCPYDISVNVLLTDDKNIREINKEYRNVDKETDVLSFPSADYHNPADFSIFDNCVIEDYFDPDTGELLLGDIVISLERMIAQAELYGHSKEREIAFLTVHSMLHLFGYDHMKDGERLVMEQEQRDILNELGIPRF